MSIIFLYIIFIQTYYIYFLLETEDDLNICSRESCAFLHADVY